MATIEKRIINLEQAIPLLNDDGSIREIQIWGRDENGEPVLRSRWIYRGPGPLDWELTDGEEQAT